MSECSDVRLDLPWFVNGTLAPAKRDRIHQHLECCAGCSAELQIERRIFAATRAEDAEVVLASPPAWPAFERLLDLSEATRSLEQSLDREPSGGATVSGPPAPRVSAYAVAMAAQFAAVALLGAWLMWAGPEPAHVYRTLSTPDPDLASGGPLLQIVVAEGTSPAAVRDLATRAGAVVAARSHGEIFVLRAASADASVDAIAARLRQDERIRLVEPVAPSGQGP